jgi:hypothetical protein
MPTMIGDGSPERSGVMGDLPDSPRRRRLEARRALEEERHAKELNECVLKTTVITKTQEQILAEVAERKRTGGVKNNTRQMARRHTGATKPRIQLLSMAARKLGPSHSPYGRQKLTKEEQRLRDLYIPPVDPDDPTGKKLANKELKRLAAQKNNTIPSSSSSEEEDETNGGDVDGVGKSDDKKDDPPNNAERNPNEDSDTNQKEVTDKEDSENNSEDNKSDNGSEGGDDDSGNNSAEDNDDTNPNDDNGTGNEDESHNTDVEDESAKTDDDEEEEDPGSTAMSVESTQDELYQGENGEEEDSTSEGKGSCDEEEEADAVGTGEDNAEPTSKKKKKRKRKRNKKNSKRKRDPTGSQVEISTEELVEELFPTESDDEEEKGEKAETRPTGPDGEEVEEEKAETRTEDMLATLLPIELNEEKQNDSPEARQVVVIPESPVRNFRYAQSEDLLDLESVASFPRLVVPMKDKYWLSPVIGEEYWSCRMDQCPFKKSTLNFLNANKPMYSHFPKLPDLVLLKAHYSQYEHYFKVDAYHVPEATITAIVGKRAVKAKDINTLAPGTWLNDNVIDAYARKIAYQCRIGEYESPNKKKIAVFDSHFIRLLVEEDQTTQISNYNYKKARSAAARALRGKSPRYYDVLFFFCNYHRCHWQVICVFPKTYWIETIDSLGYSGEEWGRLIFRWLYDEVCYAHPQDRAGMFRDILPDYGWHLNTVTPRFAIQIDGYSCGLFTLANFAGMAQGYDPSTMNQDYIEKYRIFVFCELCPNTIRSNGKPWKYIAPSWITLPRQKLPPLPPLPVKLAQSRAQRRLLRLQSTAETLEQRKQRVKDDRKNRTDEEKKERATTKARIHAERIAQEEKKKSDATAQRVAKQQRIDKIKVAREKATRIFTGNTGKGGLKAQLKKNGTNFEKKRRLILDKAFALSRFDTAEAEIDMTERMEREKPVADRGLATADHIAFLKFEKGYSGNDPPTTNHDNRVREELVDRTNRTTIKRWEYNYFVGKKSDGTCFKEQLQPAWCEYVFDLVFTELCRLAPGVFLHVPLGSAVMECQAPSLIRTKVGVSFPQGNKEYCLTFSVASAMRYIGLRTEAEKVGAHAGRMNKYPGDLALSKVVELVRECAPQIGGYKTFNPNTKKKVAQKLSLDDLVRHRTPCLTIVQPIGNDGSNDHIVTVVDDLVFDTRFPVALKLSRQAFQWICGKQGCWKLGRVYRFIESHNTPQKFPERKIARNW